MQTGRWRICAPAPALCGVDLHCPTHSCSRSLDIRARPCLRQLGGWPSAAQRTKVCLDRSCPLRLRSALCTGLRRPVPSYASPFPLLHSSALESLLDVHGEEIDIARVIGQGRIACRLAQLQDLCIFCIAVLWLCHGCSKSYVHVGIVFTPQLPLLPIRTAISSLFCLPSSVWSSSGSGGGVRPRSMAARRSASSSCMRWSAAASRAAAASSSALTRAMLAGL